MRSGICNAFFESAAWSGSPSGWAAAEALNEEIEPRRAA